MVVCPACGGSFSERLGRGRLAGLDHEFWACPCGRLLVEMVRPEGREPFVKRTIASVSPCDGRFSWQTGKSISVIGDDVCHKDEHGNLHVSLTPGRSWDLALDLTELMVADHVLGS